MPFQEIRLCSPTQLTTSSQTLYTVPASKTAIIKQIVVTNVTSSAATFSLYIGSATTANALFSGTSVAANDAIVINLSQVLNSTNILTSLASANTTLNITISGVENDGPLEPVATYIADNAITTAKIADSSVTTEKIAAGAIVDIDVNASAAIAPTKIAGTSVVKTDYTAKGVALIGSGVSTPTALTVGTNGQLLTVNSATATGLEWQSGVYTDYVPSITQGAAITKTTNYSRYTKISKIVTWQALFQFTAAGGAGNAVSTTLPISSILGGTFAVFGSALFYDTSINRTYVLTAGSSTGGNLLFWYDGQSNFFGALPAVTVASGDWLSFTIVYEVA